MQPHTLAETIYRDNLDDIIDRDNSNRESLSKILKDIQDEYDWLPQEILEHVSERLNIPVTKVYRAAIFGKGINILPSAQHLVDDRVCVIELLKHYLDFLQHDLCGKCLPCREGIRQMYNIVSDIAEGKGREESIELLKETAEWVVELSACNQGTIAANIILTVLADCRSRIEARLNGGEYPASVYFSR